MKRVVFVTLLIFEGLIFSCGNNKPYFKEVISEKSVSISMKEKDDLNNFRLNIPIEFKVNFNCNIQKIGSPSFYYTRNEKSVSSNDNYLIYNGETDKHIYKKGQWENGKYYPKSIYLMEGAIYIEKKIALSLLAKYNSNSSLEDIKSYQDTIKLVPYSQFRKDFPDFIEEMRKEPDSLKIVVSIKGQKENIVVKERINW